MTTQELFSRGVARKYENLAIVVDPKISNAIDLRRRSIEYAETRATRATQDVDQSRFVSSAAPNAVIS